MNNKDLVQTGYDRLLTFLNRYDWLKRISIDVTKDQQKPVFFIVNTKCYTHVIFDLEHLETFIERQELLKRRFK